MKQIQNAQDAVKEIADFETLNSLESNPIIENVEINNILTLIGTSDKV